MEVEPLADPALPLLVFEIDRPNAGARAASNEPDRSNAASGDGDIEDDSEEL